MLTFGPNYYDQHIGLRHAKELAIKIIFLQVKIRVFLYKKNKILFKMKQ